MAKVVKLSVVRAKKKKAFNSRTYRELKSAIKDIPDDLDGWALVSFKRLVGTDEIHLASHTNYSVRDPVDLSILPNLVQMLINEAIIKSSR